jgi:site-specific DNA-methyltransferase (adenine-specific)
MSMGNMSMGNMSMGNMSMGNMLNKIHNVDCLEFMRQVPDNYFDLVLTDPPYGLGDRLSKGAGKLNNTPMKQLYLKTQWEDIAPDNKIFNEIFRISKNQIIWGGNYFDLPPTRGFICWDKKQPMPTLSACEYAWTSFDKPAKLFAISSTDLNRKHPTQKPIELMKFCLNYAKVNAETKIFDPFMGSGTTAIACESLGLKWCGCELEPDYVEIANNRLKSVQLDMFRVE